MLSLTLCREVDWALSLGQFLVDALQLTGGPGRPTDVLELEHFAHLSDERVVADPGPEALVHAEPEATELGVETVARDVDFVGVGVHEWVTARVFDTRVHVIASSNVNFTVAVLDDGRLLHNARDW
jgi:hypothetical protein